MDNVYGLGELRVSAEVFKELAVVFRVLYRDLRDRYIFDEGVYEEEVVYRGSYSGFDEAGFVYEVCFSIDRRTLMESERFDCRIDSFRYRYGSM